jgi:hypothetical protein
MLYRGAFLRTAGCVCGDLISTPDVMPFNGLGSDSLSAVAIRWQSVTVKNPLQFEPSSQNSMKLLV